MLIDDAICLFLAGRSVAPRSLIDAERGLIGQRDIAAAKIDRDCLSWLDTTHLEVPPAIPATVGMGSGLDANDAALVVD